MDDHPYKPIVEEKEDLRKYSSDTWKKNIDAHHKKQTREAWVNEILRIFDKDWNVVRNDEDSYSPIFNPQHPEGNCTYKIRKAGALIEVRFHLAMCIAYWRDIPIPDFI